MDSLKKDSSIRSIKLNDSALLLISEDSTKFESAILLTERAIQLDSTNLIAHINRVNWLCKSKKYAEAFKEIEILDKIEPGNSETIFLYGLLAEKLNKDEIAHKKYKESLQLSNRRLMSLDSDDKMYQKARVNWASNLYFSDEVEGKKEFKEINSEYSENKIVLDFLSLSRDELLTKFIQNR